MGRTMGIKAGGEEFFAVVDFGDRAEDLAADGRGVVGQGGGKHRGDLGEGVVDVVGGGRESDEGADRLARPGDEPVGAEAEGGHFLGEALR